MLPVNIWTHLANLKLNIKKLRSWDSATSFMANRRRKGGSSDRFLHLSFWKHCGWCLQPWNQKTSASWQESYDKPKQCVEKQKHHSAQKLVGVWPFHLDSLTFCPVPIGLWSPSAFWSFKIPKIILSISLPSPDISHLFKIFWWEMYLEARC